MNMEYLQIRVMCRYAVVQEFIKQKVMPENTNEF